MRVRVGSASIRKFTEYTYVRGTTNSFWKQYRTGSRIDVLLAYIVYTLRWFFYRRYTVVYVFY